MVEYSFKMFLYYQAPTTTTKKKNFSNQCLENCVLFCSCNQKKKTLYSLASPEHSRPCHFFPSYRTYPLLTKQFCKMHSSCQISSRPAFASLTS